MNSKHSDQFIHEDSIVWENLEEGIRRKILSYESGIMMAKIAFDAGAIGTAHSHPHIQCSYVLQGEFRVTIDGRTDTLKTGDSFLVPSGKTHGAVAVTDGVLIDVFTPMREDFLDAG